MTPEQLYIWDRSIPEPNSGCWLWLLWVDERGYGQTHRGGPHRLSFAAFKGDPGDLFVCHKCDNPSCVNPDHLFLGTALDNNLDRKNKGRTKAAHSEQHGRSKFTAEQVAAIRADTRINRLVAADYGVHRTCISKIRNRRNWIHV